MDGFSLRFPAIHFKLSHSEMRIDWWYDEEHLPMPASWIKATSNHTMGTSCSRLELLLMSHFHCRQRRWPNSRIDAGIQFPNANNVSQAVQRFKAAFSGNTFPFFTVIYSALTLLLCLLLLLLVFLSDFSFYFVLFSLWNFAEFMRGKVHTHSIWCGWLGRSNKIKINEEIGTNTEQTTLARYKHKLCVAGRLLKR